VEGAATAPTLPGRGPAAGTAAVRALIAVADEYRAGYVALLRAGSVIATSDTDAVVDRVRDRAVRLILEATGAEDTPPPLLTLRCWIAAVEGTLPSRPQERSAPREEPEGWPVDQRVATLRATGDRDPSVAPLVGVARVQTGSSRPEHSRHRTPVAYRAPIRSQPSTSSGVRGAGPT
jgi:hypothetical protein